MLLWVKVNYIGLVSIIFLSQNCNEKVVWKNAEGAMNPHLFSPFFLNLCEIT